MTRPPMRFVPIKEAVQQEVLVIHRVRKMLMRQRTQLINGIRGNLAEFGLVGPERAHRIGLRGVREEAGDPGAGAGPRRVAELEETVEGGLEQGSGPHGAVVEALRTHRAGQVEHLVADADAQARAGSVLGQEGPVGQVLRAEGVVGGQVGPGAHRSAAPFESMAGRSSRVGLSPARSPRS